MILGAVKTTLALCLVGCGFSPHPAGNAPADASGSDADIDAMLEVDAVLGDAPEACTLWHPQHFMPCELGSPGPMQMLTAGGSPYTYDTTNGGGDLRDKTNTVLIHSPITLQQGDNTAIAVLSVAKFGVGAGAVLNVIGPKPLIIASWDTLDVIGEIDAGSHTTEIDATKHIQQTTQHGAGAMTCASVATVASPSAATPGQDAAPSGGSGGGGGGAYHGGGGDGATGDQMCTGGFTCPRTGGAGGNGAGMPAAIHGGCNGADSGKAGSSAQSPATSNTVAKGGLGGGGLELAVNGDLHIAGTVRAGGAAGAGAPQGSAVGGGGGGAGGYLGFDAHKVEIMASGTVAANGAGGGGSAPFAGFGAQGEDGQPSGTAANGGGANGGTCGLPGAKGSSSSALDGTTATGTDTCGGGGGGGAGGWAISWATMTTSGGTVSPALTVINL